MLLKLQFNSIVYAILILVINAYQFAYNYIRNRLLTIDLELTKASVGLATISQRS